MTIHGRPQKMHRLVWASMFGRIPEGMVVMHRCDNPRCIRPSHLKLGTMRENALDMQAKGRKHDQRADHEVCQRGHVDWITESTGRRCRTCRNVRQRERYRAAARRQSAQLLREGDSPVSEPAAD